MANVAILGAGTWGITLAKMLCETGNNVIVWSALKSEVDYLSNKKQHPKLEGINLPCELIYTSALNEACYNASFVVFAVPSVFIRQTAQQAKAYIEKFSIIVNVAKGIESHSLLSMNEVIQQEIGDTGNRVVALSGPSHAEEVAKCMPTTIVAASSNDEAAQAVQQLFSSSYMRVYTNDDVKGIETSAALKNIIAIACGISTGLGYGDNAKAALITRGMAEITRLGAKLGCRANTFASLAGIGDLIVTCTSLHSRNNCAGILIGKGLSPNQAKAEVGMVVEGLNALEAAIELSNKYNVDMPICQTVNAIVQGHIRPKEALDLVMARKQKHEMQNHDEDWF